MSNDERAVAALLERGGAGPSVDPPVGAIVAAGRQRVRRRHALQIVSAALAVGVVAVSTVAVVSDNGSASSPPSPITAGPLDGPTAHQLADGHWLRIPRAPFRLCDPTLVSAGGDVVALQRPFRLGAPRQPCTSHAAMYDPSANHWMTLPAPSASRNDQWVAAWGGGQLIVVSSTTGATQTLHPGDAAWQPQDVLPSRGVQSIVWTGRNFVANVVDAHIPDNRSNAATFELQGHSWMPVAGIPKPASGYVGAAPLVVFDGAIYSLATIDNRHDSGASTYTSGRVELLRLHDGGWTPVTLSAGVPKTQIVLTATAAGILVAGSRCPSTCTLEDGAIAMIRPATGEVTMLSPPTHQVPYPYDTTAGRDAVVLTYPEGSLGEPSLKQPPVGSSWVYDLSGNRWLPGPTESAGSGDIGQATWTREGVVTIGSPPRAGGWLLQPAQ